MVNDTLDMPEVIPNWVNGAEHLSSSGQRIEKRNPHDGTVLSYVTRSQKEDVDAAVDAVRIAQKAWAALPGVERGNILLNVAMALKCRAEEMAVVVAKECGKSPKEAFGETMGAVQQGVFMAGEGMRLFGRTTTSGVPGKQNMTVRSPMGIAGLIIAANTPIANVAWKVFPALICGNAALLKASEDAPATAWLFAKIAHDAGLPAGVLNVIQGLGEEAGAPIVEHPDVAVISFTGSTAVGRLIARVAGDRLAKVSLELGGKNALVVCDDADLDRAVEWTVLSAFSNAGQRCAAGSRIIVFDAVYEAFREKLLKRTAELKMGPTNDHDFGPVINERQLTNMLTTLDAAREQGVEFAAGGHRLSGPDHDGGYYLAPTVVENVGAQADLSTCELFGPIANLYRVSGFAEAVEMANASPYGLTAAIHTQDFDRAMVFAREINTGVVTVNGGTYGSEPHMPFGGPKHSGNGSREPGTEALDVYSSLKNVCLMVNTENA